MAEVFDFPDFDLDRVLDEPLSTDKWKKICFVCQEKTKPGQEHAFHYGGFVCFSCRAFFRRANQGTKNPVFICKKNGCCVITPLNRRHCQKCRYKKCLAAGLNPDFVLTEDQKKIRFRKIIRKKKKMSESLAEQRVRLESTTSNESSEHDNITETSLEEDHHPISEHLDSRNVLQSSESDLNKTNVNERSPVNYEVLEKILSSQTRYSTVSREVFRKIEKLHFGDMYISLTKEEFCLIYNHFCEQFRLFAEQLSDFVRLPEPYQNYLLKQNGPVYSHFCLAAYLGCSDGQAQVKMVHHFLQNSDDESNAKIQMLFNNIQYLSLGYFNMLTGGLFDAQHNLNFYDFWLQSLDELVPRPVDPESLTMFAHQILFYDLQNPGTFDQDDPSYQHQPSHLRPSVKLKKLHQTLTKMSNALVLHSIPTFEIQPRNSLDMPYTENEERWLHKQFDLMEEAFKSVAIGEEIFKEFFMYSLGVPLSKKYFSAVFSVIVERMKQAYRLNEDFNNLSIAIQGNLIGSNSLVMCALFSARFENSADGVEQIEVARLGTLDENLVKQDYSHIFPDPQKVKKIIVRDGVNQKSIKLGKEQLDQFDRLNHLVRDVVCNPYLFKVIFLLLLTRNTTNSDCKSAFSDLHSNYKLILSRRAKWLVKQSKAFKSMTSEGIAKRVFEGLKNLDRIAEILLIIIINS